MQAYFCLFWRGLEFSACASHTLVLIGVAILTMWIFVQRHKRLPTRSEFKVLFVTCAAYLLVFDAVLSTALTPTYPAEARPYASGTRLRGASRYPHSLPRAKVPGAVDYAGQHGTLCQAGCQIAYLRLFSHVAQRSKIENAPRGLCWVLTHRESDSVFIRNPRRDG